MCVCVGGGGGASCHPRVLLPPARRAPSRCVPGPALCHDCQAACGWGGGASGAACGGAGAHHRCSRARQGIRPPCDAGHRPSLPTRWWLHQPPSPDTNWVCRSSCPPCWADLRWGARSATHQRQPGKPARRGTACRSRFEVHAHCDGMLRPAAPSGRWPVVPTSGWDRSAARTTWFEAVCGRNNVCPRGAGLHPCPLAASCPPIPPLPMCLCRPTRPAAGAAVGSHGWPPQLHCSMNLLAHS